MRLTSLSGRFLSHAGKTPDALKENAAAQRVRGRSQAVASRNSFCCCAFMCLFDQWFCEPRCAQPVVCFSIMLNSSYMIMAIAPTTTKPAKAKPICMAEPAEISK